MRPFIAITPEAVNLPGRWDARGAFGGVSYTQAVEAAGGVPLLLPMTDQVAVLDPLLRSCSGLLLSGGGDVSHQFYAPKMAARDRRKLSGVDPVRDRMEFHLVRAALERDMPILGICRGIQVLNVALGGTLVPDWPGHQNPDPRAIVHRLRWERDSRIRRVVGVSAVKANSSHHQVLGRIAPALRPVAWAEDGTVEAVEHKSARWCWAVVFHPERLVRVASGYRKLFQAFVAEAAGERTSSRDRRRPSAAGAA